MEEWHDLSREPKDLTKFILSLGISGCEIEEIYNLDSLEDSKHVHGIILLYSWNPSLISESLFTSPDVLTISLLDPKLSLLTSILTILFNSEISLPPSLQSFKDLITPLPPRLKAVALHNSSEIHSAHKSYSKSAKPMFFTTFVPRSGKVFEIDGLASGPFIIADVQEDEWLERVKHVLSERIALFSAHEVEFCIFVLISNKVDEAEKTIKGLDRKIASVRKKLGERVGEFDQEFFDGLGEDDEGLVMEMKGMEEAKMGLEAVIRAEKGKYGNWEGENVRRKHNFVPFITSFLQKLDEKKKLGPLFEQVMKKKLANS